MLSENVISLPEVENTISLKVEAVAFNCFENFTFSMYVTSLDKAPWKESTLDALICDENVVIVSSDCYSNLDGKITLYDPDAKVLSEKF